MSEARDQLLTRILADVAAKGLGDRSLRELAASVGTSHRMLLYHFGSRAGLVAAIVTAVEAGQREVLRELAAEVDTPSALVMRLWERVSSPELRPFVRLFFELVGASGGSSGDHELTEPWFDDAIEVAGRLGVPADPVEVRLGVAVTRGLLIDVLTTGEVESATAALERFVALWDLGRRRSAEA